MPSQSFQMLYLKMIHQVNYYNSLCSHIFISATDASMAFDYVNYFAVLS